MLTLVPRHRWMDGWMDVDFSYRIRLNKAIPNRMKRKWKSKIRKQNNHKSNIEVAKKGPKKS